MLRTEIPACVIFSTALVYTVSEFYILIKCEFTAAEVRSMRNRHMKNLRLIVLVKSRNSTHRGNLLQTTEGVAAC